MSNTIENSKAAFEEFVKNLLIATATDSASENSLTVNERNYLLKARDRLEDSVCEIVKCVERLPYKSHKEHLYTYLHIGFASVFKIGSYTLEEPTERVVARNRAGIPRDARTAKAARRNPALDAAIITEARAMNRTLAASIECAGEIRNGVLVRLELEPDPKEERWPSKSHIKSRISGIKSANSSRTNLASAKS
jgi:hypothetical protein